MSNNKEKLLDLLLNGSISKDIYNNRLKALINNDIIQHNDIHNDHRVSKLMIDSIIQVCFVHNCN